MKKEKDFMVVHPDRLAPEGGSSGSGWREVAAGKPETRDETKHSPRNKKRRYACRLFGMNSLTEGAM
jgi:hypothetical protein